MELIIWYSILLIESEPFYNISKIAFFLFTAEADGSSESSDRGSDVLTCGSCQRPFALSDIVRFIQHKVLTCHKEPYASCHTQGKH